MVTTSPAESGEDITLICISRWGQNVTIQKVQWRIGASVGRKFSKRFALNKTAQKVDYNPAQTTAEPSDSDEPSVTPGGGDPNAGND